MKIHEYNEMMRHLTRREPSDKHLAAMPLYEQGGRVGYKPGGIVEPGVTHYGKKSGFDVLGREYGAEALTENQIAAMKKNLPDGISLVRDPKNINRWNYRFSLEKGERGTKNHVTKFKTLRATSENLEKLIEMREAAVKELFPNRLTNREFKRLRFLPDNLKLTDQAFADVLHDLGYKKTKGEGKFEGSTVAKRQSVLGISEDVGKQVFKGPRPKSEVLRLVRESSGGEELLQIYNWDKHEKRLRNIANTLVIQENVAKSKGYFPKGNTNESKLWNSYKRAADQKGSRITIVGEFADGNLPKDVDGYVDWYKKDKNGVPAWKRVEFVDSEAPKGKQKFKWGNLKADVDKAFGEGFFTSNTKGYDLAILDNQRMVDGQKISTLVRDKTLMKELEDNIFKSEGIRRQPTQLETDTFMKKRKPGWAMTEGHHVEGVANNPYKVEPAFRVANQKLGNLEKSYKAGKIDKATFIKEINELPGGIQFKVDDILEGVKSTEVMRTTAAMKEAGFKDKTIKKLAEVIERGPEGIKFLNKQAVAQTMWKAIGDKGGKICSPRIVKKAEGGRIGFAEKTCGLAFATKDPAGYMAEVKKNKDALNAFKLASQSKKGSDILKAARAVARDTMNPVGWIGGELLISGGITAAMLGEGYTTRKAIDDGLAWFLPKSVLKSRLNEIEDMAKKEGVDFETLMPFFQLETIAEEHDKAQQTYLKNTDPLYALSPQQLEYFSIKMFGKPTSKLTIEEAIEYRERLKMPSASGRGGKFYRQQAIDSSMAGMGSANRKFSDIIKNLKEPFEKGSTDWVLPGVLKQELENIADMSQTERAKANQLESLKSTYDKGLAATRGQGLPQTFEEFVHKQGKGDLFFNEFQRGPDRREFLTDNLFNPIKQEPYKMKFPGRESIDFSAVPYATGGRVGLKKGKRPFSLSRRGFLQWLAGITGATIAGGTGLIKLGSKTATKVAPQVTEEVIKRSADGMPTYIADLIQVIKAKGVKKIMDSDINKFPDTVHTYKGVDVTEDAAGNIKIKHEHPYYSQQDHIQIEKGQMNVKDEGLETQKSIQEPDEYIEGTVRPDRDGKFKDFEEGLDKDTHEFFKNIADEVFIKKAEGGLASYDNYLPGIDDID